MAITTLQAQKLEALSHNNWVLSSCSFVCCMCREGSSSITKVKNQRNAIPVPSTCSPLHTCVPTRTVGVHYCNVPSGIALIAFLLHVKMASSSNNLYTVRRHCKDIQRAIQPHLDRVIDECFLKRIISPEAYKQVILCGESVQPDRLFQIIQSSVIRSTKNYDLLLQVLHDILPKECSSDLLPKLNATRLKLEALNNGQVPRSASEPIISPSRPHSRFVTSFSLNCEQASSGGVEPTSDERDKENGGLRFRNIGRSDSNTSLTGRNDEQLVVPVQECADNETIGRERDEFSAAVEETRENGGDPSYLKQRSVGHQGHHNGGPLPQVNEDVPEPRSSGASGILEAVTRL